MDISRFKYEALNRILKKEAYSLTVIKSSFLLSYGISTPNSVYTLISLS